VDRHPQYRHCPAVTRAIASGIIIIEVQNDHIMSIIEGIYRILSFRTAVKRAEITKRYLYSE
jgi:hypothetical protein